MWETTADPATLRERADQCLNLARKAPSWVDTEVLRRIAGDYLRLAERWEREARERVATPSASSARRRDLAAKLTSRRIPLGEFDEPSQCSNRYPSCLSRRD